MHTIKASDLVFAVAESTVALAKKTGIEMSIADCYKSSPQNLAFAARFMTAAIKESTGMEITVIDDITNNAQRKPALG